MKVNIQPLGDYVVAEADKSTTKTVSGLYLPDKATEKPQTAKIVAVGSAVKQLKVGERILYKSYSSTEVKLENDEYLLIKEEDVLATVK